MQTSKYKFDLLTPKSKGVFLWSWAIYVWSIIFVCQKEIELINVRKPLFNRQTDGQTAMVKPVYPPPHNFVSGVYDEGMTVNGLAVVLLIQRYLSYIVTGQSSSFQI